MKVSKEVYRRWRVFGRLRRALTAHGQDNVLVNEQALEQEIETSLESSRILDEAIRQGTLTIANPIAGPVLREENRKLVLDVLPPAVGQQPLQKGSYYAVLSTGGFPLCQELICLFQAKASFEAISTLAKWSSGMFACLVAVAMLLGQLPLLQCFCLVLSSVLLYLAVGQASQAKKARGSFDGYLGTLPSLARDEDWPDKKAAQVPVKTSFILLAGLCAFAFAAGGLAIVIVPLLLTLGNPEQEIRGFMGSTVQFAFKAAIVGLALLLDHYFFVAKALRSRQLRAVEARLEAAYAVGRAGTLDDWWMSLPSAVRLAAPRFIEVWVVSLVVEKAISDLVPQDFVKAVIKRK